MGTAGTALAVFFGVSAFVAGTTWLLYRRTKRDQAREDRLPPPTREMGVALMRASLLGTGVLMLIPVVVIIAWLLTDGDPGAWLFWGIVLPLFVASRAIRIYGVRRFRRQRAALVQ